MANEPAKTANTDENKSPTGAPQTATATQPADSNENVTPSGTTEYYLMDLMYHKTTLDPKTGEPKGTAKRYRQGDVLSLTPEEAEPLLADPIRPSIVNKAEWDRREEKRRKRLEEDAEDGD